MSVFQEALDCLSGEAAHAVDRPLVHKHRAENVLLERIAPLGAPEHRFAALVRVEPSHPFFFDHPLDHVPGMLLIEAARQFGVAVSHRYYGVPGDFAFVLEGVEVSFERYAELDQDVIIVGETHGRRERRGVLAGMVFAGSFQQGGVELGRMTGRWRMMSPALQRRLRRR